MAMNGDNLNTVSKTDSFVPVKMERAEISQESIRRPRGLDAFLEDLPRSILENFLAAQNLPKIPYSTESIGKGFKTIGVGNHQKLLRKFSSAPDLREIARTRITASNSPLHRFASHEQLPSQKTVSSTIEEPEKQTVVEDDQVVPRGSDVTLVNTDAHSDLATNDSEGDSNSLRELFLPLLHILPVENLMDASIYWNKHRKSVTVQMAPTLHDQIVHISDTSLRDSDIANDRRVVVDDELLDENQNGDVKFICDNDTDPTLESTTRSVSRLSDQMDILCVDDPVLKQTIDNVNESTFNDGISKKAPRSAYDALYKVLLNDDNDTDSLLSLEELEDENQRKPSSLSPSFSDELMESCVCRGQVTSPMYALPCPVDQILPGLSFQSSKTWLSEPKRAGKIMGAICEWPVSRQGVIKLYEKNGKKNQWLMYFVQLKASFIFFYPSDYLSRIELNEPTPPVAYIRLSERSAVDISYRYLKFHRFILSVIRVGTDEYIRKVLDEPEVNFIEFSSEQKLLSWALDLRRTIEAKLNIDTVTRNIDGLTEDTEELLTPLRNKASVPFRISSRKPKSTAGKERHKKRWPLDKSRLNI